MNSYSNIELQIQVALTNVAERAKAENVTSDTIWTKLVKEELGLLGEKLGNKICTSGFGDYYNGEWLYDIVWYKEDSIGEREDWRLIDIPLIVESEWKRNFLEIKYDFEKLLVSNASHRLFICYLWQKEKDRYLTYFKDAVEKYKLGRSGDRFMIAILEVETKDFVFELIVKK